MATTQQSEKLNSFESKIKNFSYGLFVTASLQEGLRARPMHLLERDNEYNLWMASEIRCDKIDEIHKNPHVCITFQSGQSWISVSGIAHLVTDKERIKQLWKEGLKLWFPEGPESPNLVLIKVVTQSAEFWDLSGPLNKLQWIFESGKCYLQGKKMEPEKIAEHEKVSLNVSKQEQSL